MILAHTISSQAPVSVTQHSRTSDMDTRHLILDKYMPELQINPMSETWNRIMPDVSDP